MQSQDFVNVFHYLVGNNDDANNTLQQIVTGWATQFDTAIVSKLATAMAFQTVKIENLTDGLDIYEGSFTATGDVAGETLPTHDSMSVKLTRQTRLTRNGRKSFGGLAEASVSYGTLTYDQTALDDIEDFLSQPIEVDVDGDQTNYVILNPVIIGRTKNIDGVYELDLNKINNIIGAVVNPVVSTQNSRKR